MKKHYVLFNDDFYGPSVEVLGTMSFTDAQTLATTKIKQPDTFWAVLDDDDVRTLMSSMVHMLLNKVDTSK